MGHPQTSVAAAPVSFVAGPVCLLLVDVGPGHVPPLVAVCASSRVLLVAFLRVHYVADAVSGKAQRLEVPFAAGSQGGQ